MVENVQRKFKKHIKNLTNIPYEERLKLINLPSLEYRLIRDDMRFREHARPRGLIGIHFQACNISPADEHVQILGKHHGEKLLSLEALFINKLKPNLNSKDEYRSRVLKLKF